jgi:hypothetical protein
VVGLTLNGTSLHDHHPQIFDSPTQRETILLWELDVFGNGTEISYTDIILRRLNGTGYPATPPTSLGLYGFGDRLRNPGAAYMSRTNELLVAFEADDPFSSIPDSEIKVAALSAVNLALDANISQVNVAPFQHNEHSPVLDYDSTLGQALIVWFDGNHTEGPFNGRNNKRNVESPFLTERFNYFQQTLQHSGKMDTLTSSKKLATLFTLPGDDLVERQVQPGGPTALLASVICTDRSTTGTSAVVSTGAGSTAAAPSGSTSAPTGTIGTATSQAATSSGATTSGTLTSVSSTTANKVSSASRSALVTVVVAVALAAVLLL